MKTALCVLLLIAEILSSATLLQPLYSLREGNSDSEATWIGQSKPWIVALCKFPDVEASLNQPSYFQRLMGSTYPGLDHYWREVSYETINITGSQVVTRWYVLPHPSSYYYTAGFSGLVADCTAAVDADVYFPDYFGIVVTFNQDLFSMAMTSWWTLTLDGVSCEYPVILLPPFGYQNQSVAAHEMGHGFGLWHTSGDYGQIYDNRWDVMSDPSSGLYDPTYGTIAQHTTSFNKNIVGWIPEARKYLATRGTQATFVLERLALPESEGYLMARIPIGEAPDHYYTVETRKLVGYDRGLPGGAVVIHEVDPTSFYAVRVLDVDNNGNTGDEGAMWLPGEAFTDAENQVTVCVNGETPSGFVVTVGSGLTPFCSYADFSSSVLSARPTLPGAGQMVTLTTRLINTGEIAQDVVVTATLPNTTTYVSGSATVSQGNVLGDGPLVYTIGAVPANASVIFTYAVIVDDALTSPTVLRGPLMITWKGGLSPSFAHLIVVNGRALYLPLISRD